MKVRAASSPWVQRLVLIAGAGVARAALFPLAKVRIADVRVRPQPGRGVIIASNHRSMLDFVVGLVAFRRWGVAPVTMVRGDYFQNRLYGAILRRLGAIPAGRGYGASAMDRAREVLRSGGVLAMAPEGRIPDHGERVNGVADLKPGVARLAAEFRSEILLVGISNTDVVLRKGSRIPRLFGGGGPRPVISLSVELLQLPEAAPERDITAAVGAGLARLITTPLVNSGKVPAYEGHFYPPPAGYLCRCVVRPLAEIIEPRPFRPDASNDSRRSHGRRAGRQRGRKFSRI